MEENQNNIDIMDELASRGRIQINHNVYINNLNYNESGSENQRISMGSSGGLVGTVLRILSNPLARRLVATGIGAGAAYVTRKQSPKLLRRTAEKLNVSPQTMDIIDSMLPSENEKRLSIRDLNEITYNNNGYFVLSNSDSKLNNTPLTNYLKAIYTNLDMDLQHKITVKTVFTEHYLKYLKRKDVAILYTEKWDLGKNNNGSVTYLLRKGDNKHELLIDVYQIGVLNTNSAINNRDDSHNITDIDLDDCVNLLKQYDKGYYSLEEKPLTIDRVNVQEATFEIVDEK